METKEKYTSPCIETIPLDNEISLALTSTPPLGPDESNNTLHTPDFLRSNPHNAINS